MIPRVNGVMVFSKTARNGPNIQDLGRLNMFHANNGNVIFGMARILEACSLGLNFGKVMRESLNGLSMNCLFTCKSLGSVTTAGFSKGFFGHELS